MAITPKVPARDFHHQLISFLRKKINVSTTPTGTVVTVGTMPANALALANVCGIYMSVQFTGTTNLLDVGYASDSLSTADADAYASAVVLPITTAGYYLAFDEMTTNTTARPRSVNTKVTATWTGTATTGEFEVVVGYVTNR